MMAIVAKSSNVLLNISKERLGNNNSTVNIQNFEDPIVTKWENDNSNNHTNDEQKTNVDIDKILIAQIENIYQLENNPMTNKHEVNIIKKR